MNALRPSLDVTEWPRVEVAAGNRDSSSWPIVGEENRGLREKRWVLAPDGSIWLRKKRRESRPYEPAIEVFALELARACMLDAAQATLATWHDEHGSRNTGVAVLRFLRDDDVLAGGHEVLRGVDRSYTEEDRPAHTLERVLSALQHHETHSDCDLVAPFCRLLLFDGWIGNGDRHPGNWSLVRRRGGLRFSPMYDPAGSLGAELQAKALELHPPPQNKKAQLADYERRLQRYVASCPSGFGDGKALIELDAVIRAAAARGLLPAADLGVFESRLRDTAPQLLKSFDDEALPAVRKRFILDILERRLNWLRSVL